VRSGMWSGDNWQRIRLEDGTLQEENRRDAHGPGPEEPR
jgi:hypothetical protein